MAHLGYDIWFVYHKILRTGSHWKSWCVHIVSVSLVATCTVYCLKFTDYCLLATVYCLADPGEARRCSTNSLVINWLIKSVSEPFPPTALRRRHAQTARDSSSSYKIDYDQELLKSRRALESYQWFKRYSYFTEGVNFAYCWSFSGGGSVINGATPSSFFVYFDSKIFLN